METRLATLADADMLAVLHSESFGDARWSVTQITDSLALATTYGLVAQDRGFILCQITHDETEILTLCTAPSARRTGVGTMLLVETIRAARGKGAKRMFLEVAADNEPALALYKKSKFQPTGLRPRYYQDGTDAVMLSLNL